MLCVGATQQTVINRNFTNGILSDENSVNIISTDTLPLCIGIIAYQGKNTLHNTLDSYRKHGLFKFVSEWYIFFQQINSPRRKRWAVNIIKQHPQLNPLYSPSNIAWGALINLTVVCKSPYILILEEDFEIVADENAAFIQLQLAITLLSSNTADAIRLRSRKDPGNPNWSYLTWVANKRKNVCDSHCISHVMWNDNAETIFPELKVCNIRPKTWCTSSKYAHYTNTPTMYRTEFANNLYQHVPFGRFQTVEEWIQSNAWMNQQYHVAYSDGIFKHNRLDRTLGILDPAPSSKQCHDVFVSAFYDMGSFRDSRDKYINSAVILAKQITSYGCQFHIYCGSVLNNNLTNICIDLEAVFLSNHLIFIHPLSMHAAMQDIFGTDPRYEFEIAIKTMRHHWKQKGRNKNDMWMSKHPLKETINYLMIMNTKFSALKRASVYTKNHCNEGACLVWIDIGIYRHRGHVKGFEGSNLSPMRSNTAVFSVSGLGQWPSRDHTIYLYGIRQEVAGGVMIFDSSWYRSTFLPAYQQMVNQLLKNKEVTTDQGVLSLMVQTLPVKLLTPSYYKIMARMLCTVDQKSKKTAYVASNISSDLR